MVWHKNEYGFRENIDRLPVPGCSCGKCIRASERDAEREARRSRGRGGRGVSRTAEGIVTAVTAFSGMTAEPPADQVYSAGDAYERSRSGVVDNRDEYLDEQTRASNDRKGDSSRRR